MACTKAERFIVIEQKTPTSFVTDNRVIKPLRWEVIDRGRHFEIWNSASVEERIVATFPDLDSAVYLRRLLIGEA